MKIRFPQPLKKGDKIAITAPSAGVEPSHFARLDLVLNHLRQQGFEIVEGECLRSQYKHVSAPKEARAKELMQFLRDPSMKAIMPPWGGELLVEILPLLDFEELKRVEPKWTSGFSDLSTLHVPLTTLTGMATLHSANMMDLCPRQTDPLTSALMAVMQLPAGQEITQHASSLYQTKWLDFKTHVDAPFNMTEPTKWKPLHARDAGGVRFSGRLIGGCIDTVARLVGTRYGDIPRFAKEAGPEGAVLYFENCELPPCELARTLWNVKLAGWFDNLSGILIGRSSAPDAASETAISYVEVLQSVLGDLKFPILYDTDIGHHPPQLNIVNGALGTVEWKDGQGSLRQKLA